MLLQEAGRADTFRPEPVKVGAEEGSQLAV